MVEPTAADLELMLRELQVLEEENYVLNDAYTAIESQAASISSPSALSDGEYLAPTPGNKGVIFVASTQC